MTPRALRAALAALLALPALARPAAAQPRAAAAGPDAARPTLVVFVTVDQLRGDYIDRWRPQLTGGLARLATGGAWFANAHQDHATTETAPGHASTMSGRFPMHAGVVRNNAGVADPQAPLVHGARGAGASPFRFRGTTLFDWLRIQDPRARALSVSRKDRGAILPLGRAKQHVFWWDGAGGFTTSRYYADTLPDWVRTFNARGGGALRRFAGQTWTPLLPAAAYPEPDDVRWENNARGWTFPHVLPTDSAAAAEEFGYFPWMDQLTLDLALQGLETLQLGTGPQTDLLAISLSTTDAVGHRAGPDSRELHDQVLRVDRMLGAFLDSLYRVRDSSRVVVALTADHGVAPIPEVHFRGAVNARNGRVDVAPVLDAHLARLVARGVDRGALDFEYGLLFLDREALRAAAVNADSLVRALAADLRRVPGMQRVDLRSELAAKAARGDRTASRWLHAIPADLPVALVATQLPYWYWTDFAHWKGATYASHGSPHDYDTHVPVIFYGAGVRPGRHTTYARVVDMAPTLAALLGVPPTEPLDGQVLERALQPAVRQAALRVAPATAPR